MILEVFSNLNDSAIESTGLFSSYSLAFSLGISGSLSLGKQNGTYLNGTSASYQHFLEQLVLWKVTFSLMWHAWEIR